MTKTKENNETKTKENNETENIVTTIKSVTLKHDNNSELTGRLQINLADEIKQIENGNEVARKDYGVAPLTIFNELQNCGDIHAMNVSDILTGETPSTQVLSSLLRGRKVELKPILCKKGEARPFVENGVYTFDCYRYEIVAIEDEPVANVDFNPALARTNNAPCEFKYRYAYRVFADKQADEINNAMKAVKRNKINFNNINIIQALND